jgi:hypothetical protein
MLADGSIPERYAWHGRHGVPAMITIDESQAKSKALLRDRCRRLV